MSRHRNRKFLWLRYVIINILAEGYEIKVLVEGYERKVFAEGYERKVLVEGRV